METPTLIMGVILTILYIVGGVALVKQKEVWKKVIGILLFILALYGIFSLPLGKSEERRVCEAAWGYEHEHCKGL